MLSSKLFTNKWIHIALLFVLLFTLVFVIAPNNPIRERIQLIVFDHYLKTYPRVSTGDVFVVDIDDESLKRLGQWPWPRTKLAQMIDNLSEMGAKVIAFDGVLAEPDRTSLSNLLDDLNEEDRTFLASRNQSLSLDNDLVLAESIKRYGRFVSGFTHGIKDERPTVKTKILMKRGVKDNFVKHAFAINNTAQFLPLFLDVSAGNGSFMADSSIDNVIRKTPLFFTHKDSSSIYPSLSLEIAKLIHPKIPRVVVKENQAFGDVKFNSFYVTEVGEFVIPTPKKARLWVHFRQWDQGRDYIPAYQVIDSGFSEDIKTRVKDKVIYIASSAEGLKDLRSTPLGLLPGVEIHVNATEQILSNHYLKRPFTIEFAENFFIFGVGLIFVFLTPFVSVLLLMTLAIISVGSAFSLSYFGFHSGGFLIDPVYPSVALLIIFVASALLKYIRSEADRRQIKDAFGHYVSPDFLKELTKNPDKLKLGGEVRDLSVMFSDIRSFTTISESLTPEELIQLMNDFLTPMSDLVMDNRGTIDKYMGDAMMAFWNAPLDDENHARNACMVALKMNDALVPINKAVKKKAESEGRTPTLLAAGIGINTGPCSVGNMGSKARFAYSALGDAVNLASRLEGQTKSYGVSILIGEDTYRGAPEFAAVELDLLQVKGKTQPVKVYALLGDEELAARDEYQKWVKIHHAMLAAYRVGDTDCAAQDLKDARKASKAIIGENLVFYYDMYSERITEMIKNPPSDDWDGVFIATSK